MKITKEPFKQIIKEELDNLMLEENEEMAAAAKAEKILKSRNKDVVLPILTAEPAVASALKAFMNDNAQQLRAQQGMNEEYDDGSGLYGPGENPGIKFAGAAAGGGIMMASPMFASLVINSEAGKALMEALRPFVDPALTALGMGGATMAGAIALAMAVALAAGEAGSSKPQ